MIKIALVDDHILLRNALGDVINKFENCQVILLARHGKELLEGIKSGLVPDLVILDVAMPVMDGYATAKVLKDDYPAIKTLILTMYDSDLVLVRLLHLGVCGFLKKDIAPHELREGIETTINTGSYYSSHAASKLGRLVQKGESDSPLLNSIMLSEAELEFLQYCWEDMTYKEIAIKMKLTPRKVEQYRDILFGKLSVKTRSGLVQFAIKNGVIGGLK